MEHDGCNFYSSFWDMFCPFTPLTAQKSKIKKLKKIPGSHHHFAHVHQISDQMMYGS